MPDSKDNPPTAPRIGIIADIPRHRLALKDLIVQHGYTLVAAVMPEHIGQIKPLVADLWLIDVVDFDHIIDEVLALDQPIFVGLPATPDFAHRQAYERWMRIVVRKIEQHVGNLTIPSLQASTLIPEHKVRPLAGLNPVIAELNITLEPAQADFNPTDATHAIIHQAKEVINQTLTTQHMLNSEHIHEDFINREAIDEHVLHLEEKTKSIIEQAQESKARHLLRIKQRDNNSRKKLFKEHHEQKVRPMVFLDPKTHQAALDEVTLGQEISTQSPTILAPSQPDAGAKSHTTMPSVFKKFKIKAPVQPTQIVNVNNAIKIAEQPKPTLEKKSDLTAPWRYLCILGASMGGPAALKLFFDKLPPDLPIAVVIVQHMPETLQIHLPHLLTRHNQWNCSVLTQSQPLKPGEAILVPALYQVDFDTERQIILQSEVWAGMYRPCISDVLERAVNAYGQRVIGIMFSGMGDDGSSVAMHVTAQGGRLWAQDATTCSAPSQPDHVRETGQVEFSGSPQALARHLIDFLNVQ